MSNFRQLVTVCLAFIACNKAFCDEREKFFEQKIRPLLIDRCVSCHGPDKQEAGIRLDSREQVISGTDDLDALVVPNSASESRLLQVVLYSEDDTQMPPKAKLADNEIADIKHWISTGAVWPKASKFGTAGAVDPNAWKNHWAFQPITDPPKAKIGDANWHPLDAYVRYPLKEKEISPAPLADARTLVRRISYAVTGLPPELSDLHAAESVTPAEHQKFLNDYTDRLLASPQFGERWARYWLDISRYADTKGYVFKEDREYKDAWKYRDWVIQSFNDDMPYNEFLKRQIAADQLSGGDDPKQLAAMGFITLGRRFLNNKHDIIDDRIDVLTRGTMALTVTCARCHDHKFDPIPTADYYSLYGVFDSSNEPKDEPSTLRLVDRPKPREPVIFVRGNDRNRGERVTRHFLTALSKDASPTAFKKGSGRLELAEKIASPQNPLTARVAVNRIWIRLFGKGLVDSPSDFGVRTPPPSHPELLDHLATFFIRNNWSRKRLIRYILVSHTWRQSSAARPELFNDDPENRMLARMPRRRLNFEAFRDSLLAVSEKLEPTVGGESVKIESRPFSNRRTLYARIDRQNLPNLFRTFDFASPDNHSAQRFETTVPQQALFQFNNEFVISISESLASDVSGDAESESIVNKLFEQTLRRSPTTEETAWATSFLSESKSLLPAGDGKVGWLYGWGELAAEKDKVLRYEPLPTFHQDRWGGSTKLPDEKLGWCMLNKDGGHTGHDLRHCPIRRWVADRDCKVRVTGIVHHSTNNGDGVNCHILSDDTSHGSVNVFNETKPLASAWIKVRAGQAVDFVTDCGTNESHDSFLWQIKIQQNVDGKPVRTWKSDTEFSGGAAQTRLSAIQQLAQTLLLTNEFMFVD